LSAAWARLGCYAKPAATTEDSRKAFSDKFLRDGCMMSVAWF
jgi:hypothetical protein